MMESLRLVSCIEPYIICNNTKWSKSIWLRIIYHRWIPWYPTMFIRIVMPDRQTIVWFESLYKQTYIFESDSSISWLYIRIVEGIATITYIRLVDSIYKSTKFLNYIIDNLQLSYTKIFSAEFWSNYQSIPKLHFDKICNLVRYRCNEMIHLLAFLT